MISNHRLHVADARDLSMLADESVHLVVTSPPYPLVAMWDDAFVAMAPDIGEHLEEEDGFMAFNAMHRELDKVWRECARVLTPGGFACVNIGDATRSLGGEFCLYPNHARIGLALHEAGLTPLPDILWRKPTNAPNKFMGSGMLPAGAYVTYEHEYILVFRKGGKRIFHTDEEKAARFSSAYFWEERNTWFSDVWMDLRGSRQKMDRARDRSGAFPLEVPYRLICMYTLQGDTVLDPFVGTGTSMLAAAAAGRSSVGVERLPDLATLVAEAMAGVVEAGNARVDARIEAHRAFVEERLRVGKTLGHHNRPHDLPVITAQEVSLELLRPVRLSGAWEVEHGLERVSGQVSLPW